VRILDIKCPSSAEAEQNNLNNLKKLTDRDELKFVIGDLRDYEFAKEILAGMAMESFSNIKVHFSPSFGILDPQKLAEWILNDNLNVRLQLQLHKYIWSPERRGV
jgi:7-carboxy-7-deazaguanine synthase